MSADAAIFATVDTILSAQGLSPADYIAARESSHGVSVKDAARRLGIGHRTAVRAIAEGLIPSFEVCGRRLVSSSTLDNIIQGKTK